MQDCAAETKEWGEKQIYFQMTYQGNTQHNPECAETAAIRGEKDKLYTGCAEIKVTRAFFGKK